MLSLLFFAMEEGDKAVFYSKNTSFVPEIPQITKIAKIIIFYPFWGYR